MYKVFINDKPIIFTSSLKNLEDYPVYKIKDVVFEEIIHKLRFNFMDGVYIFSINEKEGINRLFETFEVVSAGGGLVKNNQNEILFIFRNGRWDLPKGHIEKDEKIEATALREVEEECGIHELKIDRFLTTTYHIYFINKEIKIKETHWFLMHSDYKEALVPQLEEGISKAIFKSKNEIPKLFENTYENIKLVYQALAE